MYMYTCLGIPMLKEKKERKKNETKEQTCENNIVDKVRREAADSRIQVVDSPGPGPSINFPMYVFMFMWLWIYVCDVCTCSGKPDQFDHYATVIKYCFRHSIKLVLTGVGLGHVSRCVA